MNKTGNAAPITIKSLVPFSSFMSLVPLLYVSILTPITTKDKREWMGQERLRWARQFNIPLDDQLPPGFPNNTIPVMRALTAVAHLHPQKLEDVVAALYETSFVKRKDVHSLAAIEPVLANLLGQSAAKEIVSKATSAEIKKALSDNTDEALESGAFGLPWYKATNSKGQEECYWGFDHIGQVCDHLGLQKPQPGSVGEGGWKAML